MSFAVDATGKVFLAVLCIKSQMGRTVVENCRLVSNRYLVKALEFDTFVEAVKSRLAREGEATSLSGRTEPFSFGAGRIFFVQTFSSIFHLEQVEQELKIGKITRSHK